MTSRISSFRSTFYSFASKVKPLKTVSLLSSIIAAKEKKDHDLRSKTNNLCLSNNVKVVVFVPEKEADNIRKAMSDAGAGKIGNYDYCSFSSKGLGRYRPLEGSRYNKDEIGKFYVEMEERIECVVSIDKIDELIKKIRKVHCYEEPGIEFYRLYVPCSIKPLPWKFHKIEWKVCK